MRELTLGEAFEHLEELVDEVGASDEPVLITGTTNVVMVAASAWSGLQETLFLLSIPGMRESIIEGMNTSEDELVDEPDW